jgi:hypothetical protein
MSDTAGIDWVAEGQHAVNGLLRDVLGATDPATEWAPAVERHFTPALVEGPDVAHAILLEAIGVAVITLRCAAVWMDRPVLEVLDLVQRWRLPETEDP